MKKPDSSTARKTVHLSRDNRKREFLYRQLADILKKDITDGKYKPGDRLPSMDDLAVTYKVNKVTVRRALAHMNAAGLIYSIAAQGTYVSEQQPTQRFYSRNRQLTVGLISYLMVPGNTGLYHMEIIQGIREELGKLQGNLVILPIRNIEPQVKILDQLSHANLDAVIYLGMFDNLSLRRMIEGGPPSVLVDYGLRSLPVDTILVDNRGGSYQAIEHLITLGHRKLAVILGQTEQAATKERLEGVFEAMDQAGIPRESLQIVPGDFQREGGYRAMADILSSGNVPTGIFCFNDEMAAGALQALHSLSSFTVPRDVSIVGFDDTAWATATQPPLTTVQVDKSLMGRLAVQRVVARIKNQEPPTTTILPTKLVSRSSTTAPTLAAVG